MTERHSDHPTVAHRLRRAVARRVGVDPRALAVLRVALGSLLLVDLGLRARDLTTFYSDAGALPRTALDRLYPAIGSVSLHAASGEVWVQALLFLVAAAFATALLVGYRTRVATVASLVLLVSLHARNPMVLNAGDVLFRRLLFWGVFLPLGARWALESRSDGGHRERVAGVATAALLVQVVLVYFSNVAFKLRTDAWLRGEAVRYVFELDQFTVGIAPVVAGYPALLEAATLAWFALLCGSPLLVLLTGKARTALVSLFAAGHAGMFATMDLGIFPLVSLAALVPFLPPPVWDRVEARVLPMARRLEGRSLPTPRRLGWWPTGPRAATARSALVAGLLATMLLLNAVAAGVVDRPASVPAAVEDRSWNMFGNPPQAESWYVAHATLESGREVTGHVSASRWGGPPDGTDRYSRARWRKFQSKLAAAEDERLLALLAGDVCRRWSGSGDEAVSSVTLERVREESNLDGPDEREGTVLGTYDC